MLGGILDEFLYLTGHLNIVLQVYFSVYLCLCDALLCIFKRKIGQEDMLLYPSLLYIFNLMPDSLEYNFLSSKFL